VGVGIKEDTWGAHAGVVLLLRWQVEHARWRPCQAGARYTSLWGHQLCSVGPKGVSHSHTGPQCTSHRMGQYRLAQLVGDSDRLAQLVGYSDRLAQLVGYSDRLAQLVGYSDRLAQLVGYSDRLAQLVSDSDRLGHRVPHDNIIHNHPHIGFPPNPSAVLTPHGRPCHGNPTPRPPSPPIDLIPRKSAALQ